MFGAFAHHLLRPGTFRHAWPRCTLRRMATYQLPAPDAVDEAAFEANPSPSTASTSWRYRMGDTLRDPAEPRGLIEHVLTIGIVFGISMVILAAIGFRLTA